MNSNLLVPFWNDLDVLGPPVTCCRIPFNKSGVASANLGQLLNKVLNILENLGHLHKESGLLSRLVYRMKKKFRNDKGFKAVEKVNKALRHYLILDYKSIIEALSKTTYENNGPSREMLEWCLVRLQGFAALFNRIYNSCIEAMDYMSMRVKMGQFWNVAMICIGVISRIWIFSTYLINVSCEWYLELKQFLPILGKTNDEWLPKNYSFPESLEAWLGNPEYIKSTTRETYDFSEQKVENVISNLSVHSSAIFMGSSIVEDLGEEISRNNYPTDPIDSNTSASIQEDLLKKRKINGKSQKSRKRKIFN